MAQPPPPPPGGQPPPGGAPPPPPGGDHQPPPEGSREPHRNSGAPASGGYPPPGGSSPPSVAGGHGAPGGPGAGLLPIRTLTVGDILDGAFRLLRARFARIALLVLVVLGPYQLLSSFLTARWLPEFGTFPGPETGEVMLFEDLAAGEALSLFSVTGVLGFIVHFWVAGALVWLVLREDRGETVGIADALRGALGRGWPLIGASLLVVGAGVLGASLVVLAAVALGALALPLAFVFGIPAMLALMAGMAAATSVVVPVVMIETDAGAARAAGRALRLVWRRLGRMMGVTVLVLLVLLVVTMAISLVLMAVSFVAGPFAWVVDGISGTAVSMITTPVTIFAALLLYVDARVRLEGWDLELRAAARTPW